MTNPYRNPESEPSHASPTSQKQNEAQPPKWKKVLAWASVIFGIIFILGGVFGANSARGIIGGLLFGAATCAPGLWWLYCEKKDKEAREAAAQHTENYSLLSETDRALLGEPPAAEKTPRRWPVVAIASIVALFLGASLIPTEEPVKKEPKGAATVETSEVEVTITETAPESPKQEPTEEKTSEEQPTEQPPEESVAQEPAMEEAPADVPDPEPAYEPPAAPPAAPAAPPASTYYSSCAQAKADGAAPLYAGSPGYSSNLDRDGDGVACEN